MFVESFQGQYKDGTSGTRDYRVVSASFLIIRLVYVAILISTTAPELCCVLFTCTFYLHAIIRPYKLHYRNNIDLSILLLLILVLTVILTATFIPATNTIKLLFLTSTLLLILPHLILTFYICYKLAKKAGITQCLQMKYQTLKTCFLATRSTRQAETNVEAGTDITSLTDRLITPDEYEPVVLTTEEHRAAQPTDSIHDPRKLTPVYTYGSFN